MSKSFLPDRGHKDPPELALRRWHFDQALANSMQEGFAPTEEYLALREQIFRGEVTVQEAIQSLLPERDPARLLVYADSSGQWRWLVQDENARELADGEGFATEQAATEAGNAARGRLLESLAR